MFIIPHQGTIFDVKLIINIQNIKIIKLARGADSLSVSNALTALTAFF